MSKMNLTPNSIDPERLTAYQQHQSVHQLYTNSTNHSPPQILSTMAQLPADAKLIPFLDQDRILVKSPPFREGSTRTKEGAEGWMNWFERIQSEGGLFHKGVFYRAEKIALKYKQIGCSEYHPYDTITDYKFRSYGETEVEKINCIEDTSQTLCTNTPWLDIKVTVTNPRYDYVDIRVDLSSSLETDPTPKKMDRCDMIWEILAEHEFNERAEKGKCVIPKCGAQVGEMSRLCNECKKIIAESDTWSKASVQEFKCRACKAPLDKTCKLDGGICEISRAFCKGCYA